MGLDLLVKNGTVVDGSGVTRFGADIGIKDGLITEVGRIRETAERTINADGLIVVTEWKEFRTLDLMEMKKRMKGAVIFDGRNIYDPTVLSEAGFIYCGIGRGDAIRQL